RRPPEWLQRADPAVPPESRAPVNGAAPAPPQDWADLVADATPADLPDSAALAPSQAPPPAPTPVKRRRPTTFGHASAVRFNNLTLKVRVGALVALVVGATVATTSVAAFFVIRAQIFNSFDNGLKGRAVALQLSPAAELTNLVRVPK